MAAETTPENPVNSAGTRRGRRRTRPYRKRHPVPAIALLTLLCLAAAAVWFKVAADESAIADKIRCRPTATPPGEVSFSPQEPTALDDTVPLPPSEITARVRNATTTLGLAQRTTNTLDEIGIGELKDPTNDPAYEHREPACYGQIRFGPPGKAAARTISLLDPCLELVATTRDNAVVDVALGTEFSGIHVSEAAHRILELFDDETDPADTDVSSGNDAGPSIEPTLLHTARDAYC